MLTITTLSLTAQHQMLSVVYTLSYIGYLLHKVSNNMAAATLLQLMAWNQKDTQ